MRSVNETNIKIEEHMKNIKKIEYNNNEKKR